MVNILCTRAGVLIFDPYALENARLDLGLASEVGELRSGSLLDAEGVHAIANLTKWRVREVGFRVHLPVNPMVKPAFLFNGRNTVDHKSLFEMGFKIHAIGKAPMSQFQNGH